MSEQTKTKDLIAGRNKWDFYIVAASLLFLLLIIFGIVWRYQDAAQAQQMLGFILPSIVAIVSAFFGVSQAGKAKVAEKNAQTAETDAKKTRQVAKDAYDQIEQLKHDIEPPFQAVESVFSSPSGSRKFGVRDINLERVKDMTVDAAALSSARTRIASIETALKHVIS